MSTRLQPIGVLAPGANLNAYVQGVSSFPILTVEQEQELAQGWYSNGMLVAADPLVPAHVRSVRPIARRHRGAARRLRVLLQGGNVGLTSAVKRSNRENGVRLLSLAAHWCKAKLQDL